MKVLLVAPLPPPYGGITNWSQTVLNYAKNQNVEITALNTSPAKRSTEGRSLFDRIVVSGFEMLRLGKALRRTIKNSRPDVIHITTSGSLAVIRDILLMRIAASFNLPTVYHIHFGRVPDIIEKKSFGRWLLLKALKMATAVIAIDKKTYTAVEKYLSTNKVFLTPNPIDLESLPKADCEAKKQVVFLGWVVKEKGVEELIEAWNTLGKEFGDYELAIIGPADNRYLERLKSLKRVENIVFKGEMSHNDAMKALSESEIFVLPSYTEGFPNVVIEAMAYKKTIIATNVGAIPEMLCGDCGIVIEKESAKALENALRQVIGDRQAAERMAQNAYKRVKEQYQIANIYDMYNEIWEKVQFKTDK